MKKIIIPLLFLVTALWAETKVELAVIIDLRGELFSYQQMDFICTDGNSKECTDLFKNPAISSKDVDEFSAPFDLYCGAYGGLLRTALDSNILFAWSHGGVERMEQAVEFYILTGATHTLREVIEDEFTRYKKNDCFIGNDSLFKSIFASIDSGLVPEIERELK